MNDNCQFSIVTKKYLKTFHCILDEMIHGMTEAGLSKSISYNFMVQMIPHHKAAIEMSRNLLQYTTDIPLQNIALGIIEEQTKSIENMEKILCSCKSLRNCDRSLWQYEQNMDCIMETMFSEMGNAQSTNNINDNFMREMIPHHQGAIKMSELTLQYDICRELVPILNAIITSQKKGVREMQELLGKRCNC